jgi:drug/metabolite transporter (DMT)-like permease
MARTLLFVAIVVLAGEAGSIAVTHAMKQGGEVTHFSPRNLLVVFGRTFRRGWTWLGIALLAVAFFSLLAVLSWANVSFVVPATASSYIVGSLGARIFLGERLTRARWAGILLVTIGVALVCAA